MSFHFSANQYEEGYRPGRLGNWEVGRSFPERPRHRRGTTRVIADDRGHLLPGVARSSAPPWPLLPHQDGERQQQQQQQVQVPPAPPHTSDDEQDEEEGEELQVTGAGLRSGRPGGGDEVGEEGRGAHPVEVTRTTTPHTAASSSLSSGSITPATFRRQQGIRNNNNNNHSAALSAARQHKVSNPGSRNTSVSGIKVGEAVKAVSYLPPDTVEDALLPRRPEEELVGLTGSRALAIRLVDHPGPTNCTKYVVLRPNTAPTPPTTKPPLLPKRPKTAKVIKKVPEIEFALKWDLKENDIMEEEKEEEDVEVVSVKKVRGRDLPSPCSVRSVDSGIHIPKTAWADGPDTQELATRLKHLEVGEKTRAPAAIAQEPESGYGTPKSRDSRGSLPSVGSRASSGRGSMKLPLRKTSATPDSKEGSRRISIDSQKLAEKSLTTSSKSGSIATRTGKQSGRSAKASERRVKTSGQQQEVASTKPQKEDKQNTFMLRDPLAIMETMDSVFHTVPLRDIGRTTYTHRSVNTDKQRVVAATQTEPAEQLMPEANGAGPTTSSKVRHNHPGQLRSRNCVACEVRSMEEPPKKFLGPSDYRPAFRAGKVHINQPVPKPKYVRQSERYKSRLRARHQNSRIWPINTLSSPFCNRSGYGQDQYPDHMRLRTTYGMAHPTTHAHPPPTHTKSLLGKLYQ